MEVSETGCCPHFEPGPWQDGEISWQDKPFVRDTVAQFAHIPLPGAFGRTVSRMWKRIEEAGARPDDNDFLMLSSETSAWKGEIFINTTRPVPGIENVTLSGNFMTRVYDGPYNGVPGWIKDMNRRVADAGKKVSKYYFYYTTCPRCAKVYGHNYVVAFAQV